MILLLLHTGHRRLHLFSFIGFFIDQIFVSFPDCNYQNIDFFLDYFINKTVTTGSEFYFVMVFKT